MDHATRVVTQILGNESNNILKFFLSVTLHNPSKFSDCKKLFIKILCFKKMIFVKDLYFDLEYKNYLDD
jgi:hypothetical protein